LKTATVTTDPSAVRTRDKVTCGGTGSGVVAALLAAAPDRPGEAACVLPPAAATVDGELHAAVMHTTASTPAPRNLRILCFRSSLAFTRTRMPRHSDRFMKSAQPLLLGHERRPRSSLKNRSPMCGRRGLVVVFLG
jgi:hypothetical protein